LRLLGLYNSVQASYNTPEEYVKTTIIGADLDVLYYLVPWETVSPYVLFGVGGMMYKPENSPGKKYDNAYGTYQLNLGIGAEWDLGEDWKLKTEIAYHSPATEKLDGSFDSKGGNIFGSSADTYMSVDFGFQYYFSKGEPSKYNEMFSGIRSIPESVDYDRIEEIVKKYKPDTLVKEKIVESKTQEAPAVQSIEQAAALPWVLLGVNFDFNSSKLQIESFPILYHAAQTLAQNPGFSVEIQGYTDNVGTKEANMKLAVDRANKVKEYLVNHGVASERLIPVGYADDNPVADNTTSDGRKLNRRIEFKIIKAGEK
jgi:OOP family OmpA-OmpF porin